MRRLALKNGEETRERFIEIQFVVPRKPPCFPAIYSGFCFFPNAVNNSLKK